MTVIIDLSLPEDFVGERFEVVRAQPDRVVDGLPVFEHPQ